MAWGQEKDADFHISALRACQYEIFDFVPCSLPLKTLILLTFSCFLIRRRGSVRPLFYLLSGVPGAAKAVSMSRSFASRRRPLMASSRRSAAGLSGSSSR